MINEDDDWEPILQVFASNLKSPALEVVPISLQFIVDDHAFQTMSNLYLWLKAMNHVGKGLSSEEILSNIDTLPIQGSSEMVGPFAERKENIPGVFLQIPAVQCHHVFLHSMISFIHEVDLARIKSV